MIDYLIEGIFSVLVLASGIIVGTIASRKARKAEIYKFTQISNALVIIFMSCVQIGHVVDFCVGLLGIWFNTIWSVNPYLIGFLSYFPAGFILYFGMYVGANMIIPKRVKEISMGSGIIALFFTTYLISVSIINPSSIYVVDNYSLMELSLVDTSLAFGSVPFIVFIIVGIIGLIFNGIGALQKAIITTGIIRKQFLFLAFGWIIWLTFSVWEALMSGLFIATLSRIMQILSFLFLYFGVIKTPQIKLRSLSLRIRNKAN